MRKLLTILLLARLVCAHAQSIFNLPPATLPLTGTECTILTQPCAGYPNGHSKQITVSNLIGQSLVGFNNSWTGTNTWSNVSTFNNAVNISGITTITQLLNVNSIGLNPTEAGSIYASPLVIGQAAIYSNGTIVVTGNTLSHANQTVTNTQIYLQGGSGEIVTDAGNASLDQKLWSFVGLPDGTYRRRIQSDNFSTVTDIEVLTRTGALSATDKIQPRGVGLETATFGPNTSGGYLLNLSANTTSGTSNGLAIFGGTGSLDAPLQIHNASNTANLLTIDGAGEGHYGSSALLPKTVWGQVVQGASSCSIGAGSSNSGLTSCSFVATGSSAVTLNGGFVGAPICTGNVVSGTFGATSVNISATSTTSVTVDAALAGAATNETVNLVCTGF